MSALIGKFKSQDKEKGEEMRVTSYVGGKKPAIQFTIGNGIDAKYCCIKGKNLIELAKQILCRYTYEQDYKATGPDRIENE